MKIGDIFSEKNSSNGWLTMGKLERKPEFKDETEFLWPSNSYYTDASLWCCFIMKLKITYYKRPSNLNH